MSVTLVERLEQVQVQGPNTGLLWDFVMLMPCITTEVDCLYFLFLHFVFYYKAC